MNEANTCSLASLLVTQEHSFLRRDSHKWIPQKASGSKCGESNEAGRGSQGVLRATIWGNLFRKAGQGRPLIN